MEINPFTEIADKNHRVPRKERVGKKTTGAVTPTLITGVFFLQTKNLALTLN